MNYKIIWIDDDPSRASHKRTLERKLQIGITFLNTEKDSLEFFNKTKLKKIDLLIIDHKLSKFNDDIFNEGTSFAEIVKRKFKGIPVICVTAVPITLLLQDKNIYDAVFDIGELSQKSSEIMSTIEGFNKMRKFRKWNINKFLKLFNIPKNDESLFLSVIPTEIKKGLLGPLDLSILNEIYKWTRILLHRPGFLIDKKWAATLLGIKIESFNKIEKIFRNALYTGIFSLEGEPRWWKSELLQILYNTVQDNKTYSWLLGRKLSGIKEKDFSECWVCSKKEPPPNTVGFLSEQGEESAPMHYSCTVAHPQFKRELYFEELRMVRPQDEN